MGGKTGHLRCEKIVLRGVKLDDLPPVDHYYPYSILMAQIKPQFTKDPETIPAYRQKIFSVLEFAVTKKVHFCVLPEYTLHRSMVAGVRDFLQTTALPGSIFLLPLELVPAAELPEVLAEMGMDERRKQKYLDELFDQNPMDKLVNLCWVAARGKKDNLASHLQAKCFPAKGEVPYRLGGRQFRGGQVLRLFFTQDSPMPRSFAVMVCYDFIYDPPNRISPLDLLLKTLKSPRYFPRPSQTLDWFFVPQCNPRPYSPYFLNSLERFCRSHPAKPLSTTAVALVNTAGGFDHTLAEKAQFGESSLLCYFDLATDMVRPFPRTLTKFTFAPKKECLYLYRDQLLTDRISKGDAIPAYNIIEEFEADYGTQPTQNLYRPWSVRNCLVPRKTAPNFGAPPQPDSP